MARAFRMVRGEQTNQEKPVSDEEEVEAEQFQYDREEVALGKRPMETGYSEEEDDDVIPRKEARKKKITKPQQPPPEELLHIFQSMSFKGTRFMCVDTLKQLGMHKDVVRLFKECNIYNFVRNEFPGYKEETAHFLATLRVHFYTEESDYEYDPENGHGYITFTIRGKEYSMTTNALDQLFGFPSASGVYPDFKEGELKALWQAIAGPESYSSSRAKSAQFRNPAVRYMHRVLACTFYARHATGTVNDRELQLIDKALQPLLRLNDGSVLQGDLANASLTLLLLDQFLFYREWALKLHRNGTQGTLFMGGIITPILEACEVEITSQPTPPRKVDIEYLTSTHVLGRKKVNDQFIYKFSHSTVGKAEFLLPNRNYTKLSKRQNIDFCPPVELLYGTEINPQVEHEPIVEPEEPERYYFDDEERGRNSPSLKEANRRINLLQKWSKWQDKTIIALTKSVKKMKNQIKDLQSKVTGSSSRTTEHQQNTLRRSSSLTIAPRHSLNVDPTQHSTFDPARASSYEPRSRKRQTKRQAVGSPEPSASHSTGGLDPGVESPHPASHSTQGLDQPIEPSYDPTAYTQESMDAAATNFFTQP